MENQDFDLYAGETKSVSVTVTNEDTGARADLTDAAIVWVLYKGLTEILQKEVGTGITISSPATNGVFVIALTGANTEGLAGEYQHEARVTFSDTTVKTVMVGTVRAFPTITA